MRKIRSNGLWWGNTVNSPIKTFLLCVAWVFGGMAAPAGLNAFFAFDNGVGRGQWPPVRQASVLKESG